MSSTDHRRPEPQGEPASATGSQDAIEQPHPDPDPAFDTDPDHGPVVDGERASEDGLDVELDDELDDGTSEPEPDPALGVTIIEPQRPPFERSGRELIRVLTAALAFGLALLIAAVFRTSVSGADEDVRKLADTVPEPVATVLILASQYVGAIAAIAIVAALIAIRRIRVTLAVIAAGVIGSLAMLGVSTLLALDVILPAELGQLRGVSYSGVQLLAAGAAILTVLIVWIDPRWRRAALVPIALTAFARIASGAETPYDIAIAVMLGWLVGSIVLLACGSPNRWPRGVELVRAMAGAGFTVDRLEYRGAGTGGSVLFEAREPGGPGRVLKVFSPDQPETDRLIQYWRWFRLRDQDREHRFASLRDSVEHEAFATQTASVNGVQTVHLYRILALDGGGMALVFAPMGETLAGAGADRVSDALLEQTWRQVTALRRAGVAHGDLNLNHVVVRPGADDPALAEALALEVEQTVDTIERVELFAFGRAEVAASDVALRSDVAELLCSTAIEVGPERAVRVAIDVAGADAVRQALPRLQKLALRTATREAMAKQKGLLADLQSEVQEATSVENVEYEEIARFRPRTLLSFGVFAIALYALLPRLAEISDVGETIGKADWIWLAPMIAGQLFTYIGAAFALNGSVPNRVAFFPSLWAQVAAAFVDILAPASIGGMALNTRYLQKRGVDAGVAVAGVGLNVAAGFVAHIALLAAFVVWVGSGAGGATSVEGAETVDSATALVALAVLGVVAAAAGLAIAIPPTRRIIQARVVPIVRDARTGIVDLARNPRKLIGLFGGSALITLGLLAAFYCSVRAFGGDIPLPTLAVAYLIASAIAIIAPTPGGVGAVEAALIATLIRLGMDAEASVSAVFLFRTVTFWLPVLPGWISFQIMQRKNYI